MRRKRPFFQWVLFLGLLYYAVMNGLRLVGALQAWDLLAALQEKPGALYLALTGGIFALLFAAAAFLLFLRARGSLWAVRLVAVIYSAWYWLDRIFLSQAQERFTGWPFSLGLTVLLLGLAFSATSVLAELRRSRQD